MQYYRGDILAIKELKEKKSEFKKDCLDLLTQCTGNMVTLPGGEKLTIYEDPLIGFGSAEDELFVRYKDPKIIWLWEMSGWSSL